MERANYRQTYGVLPATFRLSTSLTHRWKRGAYGYNPAYLKRSGVLRACLGRRFLRCHP